MLHSVRDRMVFFSNIKLPRHGLLWRLLHIKTCIFHIQYVQARSHTRIFGRDMLERTTRISFLEFITHTKKNNKICKHDVKFLGLLLYPLLNRTHYNVLNLQSVAVVRKVHSDVQKHCWNLSLFVSSSIQIRMPQITKKLNGVNRNAGLKSDENGKGRDET